jgi:putative SOS response-associated peptidase YedK
MCGRFVLCSPVEDIVNEFHIDTTSFTYNPSYNIAPTQNIVIIKKNAIKVLTNCRWGFLPSWAKDPAAGNKMINARSETVAEKPSFRKAFKNQRCLIVADGFYEWKKEGKKKVPFFIRLKSRKPFGLAGLYNLWTSPEGEEICTGAIITTEANEVLSSVHNRMPVILTRDRYDPWLDPKNQDTEKLLSLLKPCESGEIEFYTVSTKVNSPSFNAKENVEPV